MREREREREGEREKRIQAMRNEVSVLPKTHAAVIGVCSCLELPSNYRCPPGININDT